MTSYGAFTYALAAILRRHMAAKEPVTFRQLVGETASTLQKLDYQQHPVVVGPDDRLKGNIPWNGFGGTKGK